MYKDKSKRKCKRNNHSRHDIEEKSDSTKQNKRKNSEESTSGAFTQRKLLNPRGGGRKEERSDYSGARATRVSSLLPFVERAKSFIEKITSTLELYATRSCRNVGSFNSSFQRDEKNNSRRFPNYGRRAIERPETAEKNRGRSGEKDPQSEDYRVTPMTMSTSVTPKPARGRGPADGRAFFERLWRGNFFLDRQRVFRRSRKRKLMERKKTNGKKRQTAQNSTKQHCCCCQRIQLHLLAGRRNSVRSVVR